ncbi:MAG: DNA mismatch repair protein MutS [Thermoanaerobaculia bacterium]|nr:DNA mismatch repair protein MutS [Thermoanaerobaculia bacterium]
MSATASEARRPVHKAGKKSLSGKLSASQLTPMLRQFLEVKAEHPDAILFYRMGDFFELFFEDAQIAAPILEVALTARHKGTDKEVPMCGVPHHALEAYLGKILRAGYKVAICDQVEDPKEAKGLVKRAVTRIVTPGTVSQPELLDGKEDNLLCAVSWKAEAGAGAFLDVSTGRFFVRRWQSVEDAIEDLRVQAPREILVEPEDLSPQLRAFLESEAVPGLCLTPLEDDRYVDPRKAPELLREHFGAATLRGFGLEEREPATFAAGCALAYARSTQFSNLDHIQSLAVRDARSDMVLDATTLGNLEIFRNQREGGRKATLLQVIDRTVSSGGGRLLKQWLRRPLAEPDAISERHDAVQDLLQRPQTREQIRAGLSELGDPERLLSRAVLGVLSPREAAVLRDGLRRVPGILEEVAGCSAGLLEELAKVDPLDELAQALERTLVEEPPAKLDKGGVIAEGIDAELDECRGLARDSKRVILAMEDDERNKTGISSLKIRFNKVFGYYLEVTKANTHLVPDHYIRKQTLVNAERYVTPEIKELEEKILTAEEKQLRLEAAHFQRLQQGVVDHGAGLRDLATVLSTLDVLATFAEQAAKHAYVRPQMRPAGEPLVIREGRHPVVENTGSDPFVPNDCELGIGDTGQDARIVVLTGPNMGGKSTYLRQVALIVLLAQVGSFVPAASAELGVVDRIFTRVGASDNLARGESTFMVEMIETANILHHASEHSLVILDEVGRGTSTFDGMSLAWAIVEYLHEHCRPLALFATHYHELTELASLLPGVVNRTLAVKEWDDKIVFLRRIVEGTADQSYGLHVARLAGLPGDLIDRAAEVLGNLERQEYDPTGQPRRGEGELKPESARSVQPQMDLFSPPSDVVAKILRDTDLESMTPLAALNLLASLKHRLQ